MIRFKGSELMPETRCSEKAKDTENNGKKEDNGEKEEKTEKKVLSALIGELKKALGSTLEEIKVEDVRIGLAYTGVLLSGNYGGIACTPIYEFSGCPALGFTEILKGRNADQVLELASSKNLLEAAVGIATANALSQMLQNLEPEKFRVSSEDILELICPEDRVSMIGYFAPLIPKILKITEKLTVLEKKEIKASKVKVLPSEKAEEILPNSDVIVISASTLINGTFDELLALRGKAREVVLLGPSAPLCPAPFFERGVTAIMGTMILEPLKMLTVVSEAGGTKKLHKCCGKKVAFRN